MKPSELIEQYFSCACDEAYKIRNLTDPGCFLCDNKETIEDIMTLYANQQLNDFVNWHNEEYKTSIPNSRIGQFNLSRDEEIRE